MGEISVEVDDVKHTYYTDESLVCERCDHSWLKIQNERSETCPECGEEKSARLTAESITDYPKWLWDGATSIEEMVSRMEHKVNVLRKLQESGWTLDDPPKDGHARLSRTVESEEQLNDKEVTL